MTGDERAKKIQALANELTDLLDQDGWQYRILAEKEEIKKVVQIRKMDIGARVADAFNVILSIVLDTGKDVEEIFDIIRGGIKVGLDVAKKKAVPDDKK